MGKNTKEQLLDAAARVCVEHGFDCAAFVELMKAGFDAGIASPEQALACHLTRFLFVSLQWACPPATPEMERRRDGARAAWDAWAAKQVQRTKPVRRPAA